jgi:hypothetical protein
MLGNYFILVDVSIPEDYISRGEGRIAQGDVLLVR